ncbi:MAG: OB-fold nucleic acid binding domain-containing protein, partial [Myxococcota bacterium]
MGESYESVRTMLSREAPGDPGLVRGWIRSVRHGKGVSFLDVSDGSCMDGMQVVANPETEGYESVVKQLSTGSAIEAWGSVVESPGKGQRFELHADRIELVGEAGADYPLQKKRHSFEFLRTIAHLRP